MKKYKLAVVIGRFEPAHNAHFALFDKALEVAENLVIVLGSHNSPRTIKNPWTTQERMDMIRLGLPPETSNRVFMTGVEDSIYSDADWVTNVYNAVDNAYKEIYPNEVNLSALHKNNNIALIAHNKDETTYYLNYFKAYDAIDVSTVNASDNGPAISATKIRELYFEGYTNLIRAACPEGVVQFLQDFRATEEFAALKKEYDDALKYDAQYENVPYGQINFVTVDSMVVQSGHVLLVKRGQSPGKGLWALPGGHLNINETFIQGAIRELKEETGIKVPNKVLMGSMVYDHVFDHPDRSLRGRLKKKIGRTITRLFMFKLNDAETLPKVKGSGDACEAWWFTFGEVKKMRNEMFEDHYDMVMHGLNRL